MKQRGVVLLLAAAAVVPQLSAQSWDSSGNSLLKGTYYFREVIWIIGDNAGDLGEAYSVYGNINFDGNGGYSLSNANLFQGSVGAAQNLPAITGTYAIAASGFGSISHPVSNGDSIYGLVSNGIFIASSTEAGFNDLFIAAPLASPAPTNSSFQGAYAMMQVDSPSGSPSDTIETQFTLNPDGNGNLGTVRVAGYIAGYGSASQNVSNARYFFSNGAANVNFGNASSTSLIAGTEYLYFSPDGNFVFGGSPTGWDMIVGVRSPSTAPAFSGLYYQAGLNQDESQLGSGFADLNSYYGSLKANGGVLLGHQRLLSVVSNYLVDETYSSSYTLKSDGTYDDGNYHYLFGGGGAVRIGLGDPPSMGINVAIQGPAFSAPSSAPFVDPTGVVNAASSAMFTSGVAPGEFLSIYGANLASTTKADATFPSTLAGVQVMVNNRPAPLYFVSPNQISAVVPFGTAETIASIQVISGGAPSNTVTSYVNQTAPGVFTNPPGGVGYAAALHSDYSVVTPSNPARAGETLSVFVSGLGPVNPAVADGTPGPASPPSQATQAISVYVGGKSATTSFAGLAPQLIGLYQINFVVPSGLSSGDVSLDVQGPDFYTTEALLPAGSAGSIPPSTAAARNVRGRLARSGTQRRPRK